MDGTTAQAIENNIAVATTPITVGFKRITEDAVIPTKAFPSDSGFDLVASADIVVEPGSTVVVPTGIAVILPTGYEASVRPRSGITSRTDIRVQYGTIDNGYTSGIGVIVDNVFQALYERNGDTAMTDVVASMDGTNDDVTFAKTHCFPSGTYYIPKGTRIAQLVITRLPDVEAVEVFDVEDTERGDSGFGSTGVTTKGSD